MSDVVIRAEGLGKKYLIGHEAERERYTALRDVIARARAAALRARHATWSRGRPARRRRRDRGVLGAQGRVASRSSAARWSASSAATAPASARCSRSCRRITEPTEGRVDDRGPRRQPARGRHRLPPRADRPREHLPQRRHPRHDARARSDASSTRSSPSPRSRSSSTRRSSATPAACTCGWPSPSPPTSSRRS